MTRAVFHIWLITLAGAATAQSYHGCPVHNHALEDYQNPLYEEWLSAYDVKSYDLSLSVSNTSTMIEGHADITLEAVRRLDTLVLELQDALEVTGIRFTDQPGSGDFRLQHSLGFEHVDGALYILLDRTRNPGELLQVRISYGGEAGQNRGFFAGITTDTDVDYGFDVTYTLSEPHNASDWFPVKQVLGDKIDSVTFRIRCDRDLLAGSNGVLTTIEEEGQEHVLTWKTTYPMAYYLLSFAVADYRDFSFNAPLSNPGDSVLVQNFIYDLDRVYDDWKEQIIETGSMITTYSRLLSDYPFAAEKYGHCMAPLGGGMEHQTMTTLYNFHFFLVAHELAHQWFGDYVTCGNWQDIWINEGFASYMEYVSAQEILGQEAADNWMNTAMSVAIQETTGSVYVPEERVEDTWRLFDHALSYKKGAILLHMIRFIVDDDDLFFQVLRSYLSQYGNGLATAEDFRAVLEEESGMDFTCFFDQWYYGEGFPRFKLYWGQDGDSLRILSEQTTSAPSVTPLFKLPFEVELIMRDGINRVVRLGQEMNIQEYAIPVEGVVEGISFDPGNWLLQTSTVIQQLPGQKAYRIGPNPVTGKLYIQVSNAGIIEQIRVTSFSGQEVLALSDAGNPATLDLSCLAAGPYVLEISSGTGTFKERIVKVPEK